MNFPQLFNQINFEYSFAILNQYVSLFWFYFPLGLIGIWRWSFWLIRKSISRFYSPKQSSYTASVSVITPVYNENPSIFRNALFSWLANKPDEIIAVIDYSDKNCIKEFKEFKKDKPFCKLIITKEPGKREALARGIASSQSELVALVDSDTIWDTGVLKNSLAGFSDPLVGGVATRQAVFVPQTLSQIIFDIQLFSRYHEEMPFLSASGRVLTCLSGRTAFYRRKILLPILDKLINETFWGEKVISGEDKRLTYLIQADGWGTVYQSSALVYTPGTESLTAFLKQRLRWSRNSWRADLRALAEGWVFKHPALAFHLIDRIVQPFAMLVGLVYFVISLVSGLWVIALLILAWWHIGRFIKIYSYLKKQTVSITILPFYVLSTFTLVIIKLYALATLNTQGWMTRWHRERLPRFNFVRSVSGQGAVSLVFLGLSLSVLTLRQSALTPAAIASGYQNTKGLITRDYREVESMEGSVSGIFNADIQPLRIYEVQKGDTITKIANKFGVKELAIVNVNSAFIPNLRIIPKGTFLVIPDVNVTNEVQSKYNNRKKYYPALKVSYDEPSNTISVSGRGNQVTLRKIYEKVGKKYLDEIAPKEWLLSANIYIDNGVIFKLSGDEVLWLKLLSTQDKFVKISVDSGGLVLDGVKITSWDQVHNKVDEGQNDGRSYIVAKFNSLVHINNSELSYLGYNPREGDKEDTYGVSLKNNEERINSNLLAGEIANSKFHNNYHGLSVSARGVSLSNNEFFENTKTGIYSQSYSSRLVVNKNKIYKNGANGLTLQKGSEENLITNNEVRGNSLFGILIEGSDFNIIEANSISKSDAGLVIKDSGNTIIRANEVNKNKTGMEIRASSQLNRIEDNELVSNNLFGIHIEEKADGNMVLRNHIKTTSIALFIKGKNNSIEGNLVEKNKTGIYLADNASHNILVKNKLSDNQLYHLYLKTNKGRENYLVGR